MRKDGLAKAGSTEIGASVTLNNVLNVQNFPFSRANHKEREREELLSSNSGHKDNYCILIPLLLFFNLAKDMVAQSVERVTSRQRIIGSILALAAGSLLSLLAGSMSAVSIM